MNIKKLRQIKSKRIPIKAAIDFGKKFDKDQVIIVCYDKKTDSTWVTTWGKSIKDCELAAMSGNNIKKMMDWPDELCHETPSHLKRKGLTL